jgi:hypothetical protein
MVKQARVVRPCRHVYTTQIAASPPVDGTFGRLTRVDGRQVACYTKGA